jgi:ribosome maturation factor RimP
VQELTDRVRDLAAPLVAAEGLDLVEVAVKGTGPGRLVRVAVDRKGGVDLARCESVSRQLEGRLDELAELDAGYRLAVGSPGVDRPLAGQRDFDRVEGRTVLVHRTGGDPAAPTTTQVRGTVLRAEDDAVVLDVGGGDLRVPYPEIVKATQSLPW